MKLTISFTALFIACSATLSAFAAPLDKRDVWSPPVLYPHEGTVWKLGARHNVTWDASNPPKLISNGAAIYLRRTNGMLQPALAEGFDLRTGRQEITVPSSFEPGDDYRVVLFGDSGNWSPEFTIERA
ncbi:hypothetical protein K488DRAFT_54580 [Vararia minispora EC-137]|uniref:Uncharacterized protein n=1 Tax=Vararia minispora EC-137 TaxID=1314806 RepID=A0ACB8QF85_9AGAM|nr:hypothetical protein K488DRAFT_54580 [Vararia minispora EC-137]